MLSTSGTSDKEVNSTLRLPGHTLTRQQKRTVQCIAASAVGSGESSVLEVDVLHTPSCRHSTQTRDLEVKAGDVVNASCIVDANPSKNMEFEWKITEVSSIGLTPLPLSQQSRLLSVERRMILDGKVFPVSQEFVLRVRKHRQNPSLNKK
jgi:hypothetical protein